ncbi:7344_t:CDS:1, partial [Acaulospora morrowiae]
MYFYHLKFELYVPAEDNSKDLINSSIDINNRQKKTLGPKKPADLFYVPKDIFETLPAHPQHKNESQKFLPNRNSKGHSKIRSKSLDPSQNTVHSTAK